MNNLENNIKDCISKELEKGVIEKVIAEQLEKCIEKSISDMFSWGGDIKKILEGKIKAVMIPYLENYDYSQYITKLDSVLVDVLKSTALENKKLLTNFKSLMVSEDIPKKINISEIYRKWGEYCQESIDKDKLDFDCDGAYATVNLSIEDISSSWSDFEKKMVRFECEEDESLNLEFIVSRWGKYDKDFSLKWELEPTLESLRNISEFDIFMMRLKQNYTDIILDTEYETDDIVIEYEE